MTGYGMLDTEASEEHAEWQKRLAREANRIKPSAPVERLMNDDDDKPFDVGGFVRAVGPFVAEAGSKFIKHKPLNDYNMAGFSSKKGKNKI